MDRQSGASHEDASGAPDTLSHGYANHSCVSSKSKGAIVPDDDGLTLVLGGTATALGEDTDANGQIAGTVVDKGPVSVGIGSSTFEAEATTHDDGGSALAFASSFAFAEGADIVLCFDQVETRAEGTDSASEKAQSLVIAIDFEDWDFADGPIEAHFTIPQPSESLQASQPTGGNTANFTADLEAAGANTISDVDFGVLTVEDSLSDVSGLGVVGVA